ncbi:MAG: RDD family protein, partial [Vicinamibacteria bacterium]|nr:RDD family protein [Vicinamibacteria bacterium]
MTPIEEVGPTGEKQFRDVCQDAKRHAGSVLPESILWDPYLYRGFLCCQCGRLACPDCAAVHHDDRCPFCHQETIVFAYRPFLGTRAPRAESAPSYSCPQCGFFHPSWYPRGAWVCPQCNTEIDAQGHALIRRVEHSAMEYSSDSAYWGPSRYAPIWRRAAAALIDGLILACVEVALAIVALVVSGLIKGLLAVPATQIVIAFTVPLLVTLPFWLLIAWLYSALLESSRRRATLGKTALGLMVTTDGGAQINFVRASLRFFAKLLSTLPAGAGFAIAGLTARKQALHDMLARTTVVSGHVVGVEWSVESAATPAAYAPAAARAAMPAPVSADTEAPAAPAADEAETTVFVWPE